MYAVQLPSAFLHFYRLSLRQSQDSNPYLYTLWPFLRNKNSSESLPACPVHVHFLRSPSYPRQPPGCEQLPEVRALLPAEAVGETIFSVPHGALYPSSNPGLSLLPPQSFLFGTALSARQKKTHQVIPLHPDVRRLRHRQRDTLCKVPPSFLFLPDLPLH